MIRTLLAVLVAMTTAQLALAQLAVAQRADLAVATFNTKNFNEPGKRMFAREGYDVPTFLKKRDWLAGMILGIDADIIALQEVWSEAALEDLVAALADNAGGRRYAIVLGEDGALDGRLPGSALLVRRPWIVERAVLHRRFPPNFLMETGEGAPGEDSRIEVRLDQFTYPVLEAWIGHADRPDIPAIRVFAVKMKSLFPTRLDRAARERIGDRALETVIGSGLTQVRRSAEAVALRFLVEEALGAAGVPVIVLGDFSEPTDSQTLELLTQSQTKLPDAAQGRTELRDYGGALFSTIQLEQYRSGREFAYTFRYRGQKLLMDDILISDEFLAVGGDPDWSLESVEIVNDYLDVALDRAERDTVSDHGIVVARFGKVRR